MDEDDNFIVKIAQDFIDVSFANKLQTAVANKLQSMVVNKPQSNLLDDPESNPGKPEFSLYKSRSSLREPQLIMDVSLLFLVKAIREDQIELSIVPIKETIARIIGSLRNTSNQKLGTSLEVVDYLTLLKKKLESIRPEYYSAGLAKDIQEMQSKNKLYREVKESLQYLGGYSGLVDDLSGMIKEKQTELGRVREQADAEAERVQRQAEAERAREQAEAEKARQQIRDKSQKRLEALEAEHQQLKQELAKEPS